VAARCVDWRWAEAPIAALDLEMTGLDPVADRICEVGIVTGIGRHATARWSTLVRPEVPMGAGARAIHGISDAELAAASPFVDIAQRVAERVDGRVVLAHNAATDRAFLEAAWARAGVGSSVACWVDTLQLARNLLALRSHRLAALARALGVPARGLHRALADAQAAWEIGHALLALVDAEGAWTVGEVCEVEAAFAPGGARRAAHLAVLKQARAARLAVRIAYASRDDAGCWRRTEREIAVLAVRPRTVDAWCFLRRERRVFRLERVHAASPTDRDVSDVVAREAA
jgi:DNA polymerase III epsilon subunit family exonuclease